MSARISKKRRKGLLEGGMTAALPDIYVEEVRDDRKVVLIVGSERLIVRVGDLVQVTGYMRLEGRWEG